MDQTEARFGDFFRDLAIAGRALSSYPDQHPAAVAGLAKAYAALSSLLAETGPIELAATRDALLWRGRRFTSPTAAQLAKLLRRRRAAELFFDPEVSMEELEVFLRALALDARSAREAGSLAAELKAAGLVRLRVSDLDFSSLALVEGDEEISAPEAGAFSSRVVRQASAKQSLAQLSELLSPQTAAELRQAIGKAAAREQGEAAAPDAASPRINPQQLAGLRRAFAADDVDTLRDAETPTEGLAALLELPEERTDLVLSAAAAKVGRELEDSSLELASVNTQNRP